MTTFATRRTALHALATTTLAAATLVAFGEPAQADLLMVQAASADEWLGAVSCLR